MELFLIGVFQDVSVLAKVVKDLVCSSRSTHATQNIIYTVQITGFMSKRMIYKDGDDIILSQYCTDSLKQDP